MRRSPLNLFLHAHSRLKQTEHIYMVIIAAVIGLLGGLCAVGFRMLIGLGQHVAWQSDVFTLDHVRSLPAAWKIAVPAAGGLIVGLIIRLFAREAKGHGVPEVMEAVALRGGRIRPRVVLAKMVASGVCIASGGSVGREGPIVQIGSSLGSTIGQWLGVGERRLRTLVGCGAAAGIAGTFNAPVAGALFAVEIILGDFGVSQFSPIVISSVAATVVSRRFLGDFPAFQVPAYSLVNPGELLAYAVLGILAGLVAIAFVRSLYAFEDLFDAVRIPGPAKAVLGGAIIGVIALRFPEILGVGYEAIDVALRGGMVWQLLLLLVVVKIIAVSVTIGSGGSGGIFAPSLFIGAMIGGAIGTVVNLIWPETTAGPGAYALVGMGAVVAAGTHAPITAILIIFELTGSYKIILPLMISCIIATLLATRLQEGSIYTLKLLRRGVDIRAGKTVNVLRHLRTRDVMRREFISAGPGEPLMPLVSRFIDNPGGSVFVVDDEHRLLGVITINEIRPIMADLEAVQQILIARDLMSEVDFPVFEPHDRLDEVMQRFGNYRFEAPVVEGDRVIGAIWPEDVIRSYNAEVFKRDMASSMSLAVTSDEGARNIPGVQGVSMAEIPAPTSFLGKSVADLGIRKRFDVTILLIKRKTGGKEELVNQLPDAGYVFQEGDVMLVMGQQDCLLRLERAG
jgi:CIC family chloride channel protein